MEGNHADHYTTIALNADASRKVSKRNTLSTKCRSILKRELQYLLSPSTGVRQGDALSTIILNLAAEPLLRAAKTGNYQGFNVR